jgi:hypothetical protein
MIRSSLVKSAWAAIALLGLSAPQAGAIELQGSNPSAQLSEGMISKAYVVHRGVTAVGPRGGVYHRGGTWAGRPGGYGYRGGYGYHGGYGYRPYGYGYGGAAALSAAALGAAAVGAAVAAPHCWINSYGYRVCN